jgi:ATP-dependent Clp protease ATP-binding subunit ClpA
MMLSSDLEQCVSNAYRLARENLHEFLTVEHLLLSILDVPKIIEILKASSCDVPRLKRELLEHIDRNTPRLKAGEERELQPTLGFQRALQRAVVHVQSSGRKEVTPANVLVSIFAEKQSHAVYLLGRQDVSRLDIVQYISHGVAKSGEDAPNKEEAAAEGAERGEGETAGESALEKYTSNLNERARQGKIDPLIGRQL